jgi:hypothetical protein
MEQRMEHEEIYILMMEALDGEIDAARLSDLEEHLDGCEACTQQWEAVQAIHTLFLETPLLSPAANFTQRTLARLPNPRHRIIALSAIYGMLLISGLLPLGLLIWFASQLRPAIDQPALIDGVMQAGEELFGLGQTVVGAFFQVLGTLGDLLSQQPALIGLILVMIGAIFVWGGVYSQLTKRPGRTTINGA